MVVVIFGMDRGAEGDHQSRLRTFRLGSKGTAETPELGNVPQVVDSERGELLPPGGIIVGLTSLGRNIMIANAEKQ